MVGGFVDAIGFLVVASFVSNMTGNTALAGARLAEAAWPSALFCGFLILMFVAGATVSGLLTEGGRRRGYQSVYAIALVVEALLLSLFIFLVGLLNHPPSNYVSGAILCAAMGLQNATITQIAGAVVRTTHVTGVLTDLGLESVQLAYWLRDRTRGRLWQRLRRVFRLSPRHPSLQRLFLLLSIWASFAAGAALGALGWKYAYVNALAVPVGALCVLIIFDALRPISVVRRIDHLRQDHDLRRFGIDPSVLPPSVNVYRVDPQTGIDGEVRPPDLSHLHRHLRRRTRVMLLFIPPEMTLDDNSILGLQHSGEVFARKRRHLIVCAPASELFMQLRDGPVAAEIGEANICPDAEFAVARAVELATHRR
jgi:uncharacterized membrane protein YoaK (UPF0700 family)